MLPFSILNRQLFTQKTFLLFFLQKSLKKPKFSKFPFCPPFSRLIGTFFFSRCFENLPQRKKLSFGTTFFCKEFQKTWSIFLWNFFNEKTTSQLRLTLTGLWGHDFFSWGAPKSEARLPPLFLTMIYTKSKKTAFLQALPLRLQIVPPVKIVSPPG